MGSIRIKETYASDNYQIVQYGTRWMRTAITLDWGHKKLYEVAKFRQGLQIAKVERFAGPAKNRIRLIKVMDFHSERDSDEYIVTPQNKKSVICHKDDVLIARTGTLGLVLTNVEGVFHNNTFAVDYDKEIFDKTYFCYFLKSAAVQLFIRIISTRTTQSDLTHKEFSELVVLIPPLNEQHIIASILSKVDELIQKTDQVIDQTQSLKKGLMQKLLTKGIGHTKFKKTILGDIPDTWDIVAMKQIVASYKNGIYKLPQYYGLGVASIRMFNIKDGKIDAIGAPLLEVTKEEISDYGLKPGDILINRVNSKKLVGKAGIVSQGLGTVTFESKNIRVRVSSDKVDPNYVNYFLNSSLYYNQIHSKTKAAVGQSTINQEDLDKIRLCLPPLEEQQAIVFNMFGIENKLDCEKKKIRIIERMKEGLMQILLTGKIRVKV
jgi:type I restriction enzyme, S subunit